VVDLKATITVLRQMGKLERVGGIEYLARLGGDTGFATAMVDYHARHIRDASIKRDLILKMTDVIDSARNGSAVTGVLELAERHLQALRVGSNCREQSPVMSAIEKALVRVDRPNVDFEDTNQYISRAQAERGQTSILCEGLLRTHSLSMIVGRAWAGKTTLAINFARALALGEPFLGRQCTRCRVGYMALERNGGEEVGQKLLDWGTADKVLITDAVPFTNDPREMARALAHAIYKTGLEVVFVDHLIGMINIMDGNDYAGVSRALAPFGAVAKITGTTIILLHHQPKAHTTGNEINVMGSEAFRAATDTLMEASKLGQNYFFRAGIRGFPDIERLRVSKDEQTGILTADEGLAGTESRGICRDRRFGPEGDSQIAHGRCAGAREFRCRQHLTGF
jgi:hypothetical protein